MGLDPADHGTALNAAIQGNADPPRTKNLRAVQLPPGHSKLESTVRYLGIVGNLRGPDAINVLDEFIGEARDLSLIWPSRKFIPAGPRQVTDFFATELAGRVSPTAGRPIRRRGSQA